MRLEYTNLVLNGDYIDLTVWGFNKIRDRKYPKNAHARSTVNVIIRSLAKYGSIGKLRWLFDNYCRMESNDIKCAIIEYSVEFKLNSLLEYIWRFIKGESVYQTSFIPNVAAGIVRRKCPEIFKTVVDDVPSHRCSIVIEAVVATSLGDMEFYHQIEKIMNNSTTQYYPNSIFNACIYLANIPLFGYLLENNIAHVTDEHIELAYCSGNEEMISLVVAHCENQPDEPINYLRFAARSGNLDLVKRIIKQSEASPLNLEKALISYYYKIALKDAVRFGHLPIVQYLYLSGATIEETLIEFAQKMFHLEIHQFLQKKFNSNTILTLEYAKEMLQGNEEAIDIKALIFPNTHLQNLSKFDMGDIEFTHILHGTDEIAGKMRSELNQNVSYWSIIADSDKPADRVLLQASRGADVLLGIWTFRYPISLEINNQPIYIRAEQAHGGYYINFNNPIPLLKVTGRIVINMRFPILSEEPNYLPVSMAKYGKLKATNTRNIKKAGNFLFNINGENYKLSNGSFIKDI